MDREWWGSGSWPEAEVRGQEKGLLWEGLPPEILPIMPGQGWGAQRGAALRLQKRLQGSASCPGIGLGTTLGPSCIH